MRLLTLSLLWPIVFLAHGQNATVGGLVKDQQDKQGLIGVNVVYAPGKGTVTDPNGRYSMELPPGEYELSFTYVGYDPIFRFVVLEPGEEEELDVLLQRTAAQLDMVVISAGKFDQRIGEVTQSLCTDLCHRTFSVASHAATPR